MKAPLLSRAILDSQSDCFHRLGASQMKAVVPRDGHVVDYAKRFPSTFKGERAESTLRYE